MNFVIVYYFRYVFVRYRATFDREVRVTSRLCDVNVARLLSACLAEEPRYVIMEYPRHGDLAQYLRHHSPVVPTPCDDNDGEDQLLLMTSRRRRPNGTSTVVLRSAASSDGPLSAFVIRCIIDNMLNLQFAKFPELTPNHVNLIPCACVWRVLVCFHSNV